MTHPPNVLPTQLLLLLPPPSSVQPHPQRVNRESTKQTAYNPHLDIAHIFSLWKGQDLEAVPASADGYQAIGAKETGRSGRNEYPENQFQSFFRLAAPAIRPWLAPDFTAYRRN